MDLIAFGDEKLDMWRVQNKKWKFVHPKSKIPSVIIFLTLFLAYRTHLDLISIFYISKLQNFWVDLIAFGALYLMHNLHVRELIVTLNVCSRDFWTQICVFKHVFQSCVSNMCLRTCVSKFESQTCVSNMCLQIRVSN